MKKIISKIATLGLAATTAFSFAACSGGTVAKAGTLTIAVVNKGYGYVWLEKIIEQYKLDTGKDVVLLTPSTTTSKYRTELVAGPSVNETDLYFSLDPKYYTDLKADGQHVVSGYDCVFADLSDVYETPLEDYDGKTLKEMIPDYFLDAMTFDGKQHTLPWATGLEGILYNENLMKQYNLELPNTTDEMFALFDQIKTLDGGTYAVKTIKGEDYNIYPVYYARENNYTMAGWMNWWSQYSGMEEYGNFLKGVDASGNYTPQIFAQEGRVEALRVAERMLNQTNGYTNKDSLSFLVAQQYFLDGLSFFNFNGDWLEREAEATTKGIKFMRTPVISSIVKKLEDTSMTDATLSEIIDEIDGGATSSTKCSAADFEYIKAARSLSVTEGEAHFAYVPAYSDCINEAKDFLKYYLSAKAQNIQMQYSAGNVAPFYRDVTQLEAYAGLSDLGKSKFDIWMNSAFTGRKYNTPMTYKGGLMIFNTINWPEKAFGTEDASARKTVDQYISEDLIYYTAEWPTMTRNAGI